MEKKLLKAALGGLLLLAGCNHVPTRSDLVATVGGAPVSREDALFVTLSAPESQRSPEQRTHALRTMLDTRQKAEIARRRLPGAENSVDIVLKDGKKRYLARIYQSFHLRENLAIPRDSLVSFFSSHRASILPDSLADTSFFANRERTADRLYIQSHKDGLDSFYRQNAKQFSQPGSLHIAHIVHTDSAMVAKALARLAAGEDPASVTSSNSPALPVAGGVLQITSDNFRSYVSASPALGSYLYGGRELAEGKGSPVLAVNSSGQRYYAALWMLKRDQPTLPPLETQRDKVEKAYLVSERRRLSENPQVKLRGFYKVRLADIPAPREEDYYASHLSDFQTLPAYKLYHWEMADSAALVAAIANVRDLSAFSSQALAYSINAFTASRQGEIGGVKEGHCLPYGIGMMPSLFDTLKTMQAGQFTGVLRAPDTDKFHVFYLASKQPPVQKPFERVRVEIHKLLANEELSLDSSTVLAYMGDKPLVYERDVLALRKEVPPEQQQVYNKTRLLALLVDWAVMGSEATRLGLDKTPEFESWMRLARDQLLATRLQDSLLASTLGLSDDQLRQEYASQQGKLFTKPYEDSRLDVALWLRIPDVVYRMQFAAERARYADFADWKQARGRIFLDVRTQELFWIQQMVLAQLQAEVPVRFLDSSFQVDMWEKDKQSLLDGAARTYAQKDLDACAQYWMLLRYLYPGDETNLSKATMELAKIYNEQEQFEASAREYGVYAALWPKASDAYKAMFMQGFILAENLKKDSLALPVFQDMLKRYPHTDLSDDAEWMVRNIESGGKLVPALLDSISRADQAATASDASAAPAASNAPEAPKGDQPVAQPAAKP